MWLALTAALVPVAAGVGLALTPVFRRGLRGPASAFAIAVALAVVFGELVPDAADHAGAASLIWLAIGLLGPGVLERIMATVGRRSSGGPGREIGFLGLCVHQVIDGLQVGSAMEFASPGVAVAVGAHSVPLVAAVVFGFARRDGLRSAALRGGVLLVFTAIGTALGHEGTGHLHDLGFLPALVGGLLLHVLWHDLWERPPTTTTARVQEIGAFAAGLVLPLAWGHHHHTGLGDSIQRVLASASWPLLAGLGLTALVRAGLTRFPVVTHTWSAVLPAATLPLTACSVLPVTEGLVKKRAPSGAVLAFLLLTPALGAETLVLSAGLLGPELTLGRIAVALLASLAAAALLARLVPTTGQTEDVPVAPAQSFPRRALLALDETLLHVGPWLVAGLALAVFVDAWVTPQDLDGLAPLALVALPAFVCATSAIPVAAVLIAKGASPALVLAVLLVGPALNAASLAFLRRTWGARALGPLGIFLALAAGGSLLFADVQVPALDPAWPGAWFAAAAVALLLVRSLWTVGPRGWLAVLSDLGGPGTGHDHGHDHGHAHEHRHDDDHDDHDAGHLAHPDPIEAVHAGERAHDHCHEHEDDG